MSCVPSNKVDRIIDIQIQNECVKIYIYRSIWIDRKIDKKRKVLCVPSNQVDRIIDRQNQIQYYIDRYIDLYRYIDQDRMIDEKSNVMCVPSN